MSKPFNLEDRGDISDLQLELKRSPVIVSFLEEYCGYNSSVMSSDPYEISYSGGKRDVILTIKTIMRDDLLPDAIAEQFKRK